MIGNYLLFGFFVISTCFVLGTVANQAIVDGDVASPHEFPYQVSVQFDIHICGGGILGKLFVLTAAHCVVKNDGTFYDEHVSIVAGTNDLDRTDGTAMIVAVEKIFVPAEYRAPVHSMSTADIAVLRLRNELPLNSRINLRRLKIPMIFETFEDKIAKIAGFGWTDPNGPQRHQIGERLRYAEVHVLNNNQCRQLLPLEMISKAHVCARVKPRHVHQPRGVCIGDNGSPLVYNRTIIGVLSRVSAGCNEMNKGLGIYMRVSHYLRFIDNAVHDMQVSSLRSYELQ